MTETLITSERLKAEGFKYKLDELTEDEAIAHSDPYYFYKGDFKLYDVIDKYHYGAAVVKTMEQLRELYQQETGRLYTKYEVLDDTAAPDLTAADSVYITPVQAKKVQKIKLQGGPGDGKTAIWPRRVGTYLYQETLSSGKTVGHRYVLKKGRKAVYVYVGPTE